MHHQVPVSIWVDGRYIGYYADMTKSLRNVIRGNFLPPKKGVEILQSTLNPVKVRTRHPLVART